MRNKSQMIIHDGRIHNDSRRDLQNYLFSIDFVFNYIIVFLLKTLNLAKTKRSIRIIEVQLLHR